MSQIIVVLLSALLHFLLWGTTQAMQIKITNSSLKHLATVSLLAIKKYYIQAINHDSQPVFEVSKRCIQRNKIFKELLKLTNQEENSRDNPLAIPFNEHIPIKTVRSFLKNSTITMPRNMPWIGSGKSKDRILRKMYDRLCLATYTQNHTAEIKAIDGILKIFNSCNPIIQNFLAARIDALLEERQEQPSPLLVQNLLYKNILIQWFQNLHTTSLKAPNLPAFNFEYAPQIKSTNSSKKIKIADSAINVLITILYKTMYKPFEKLYYLDFANFSCKNASNPLYNDNIISWDTDSTIALLFFNKKLMKQDKKPVVLKHTLHSSIKSTAINATGTKIVATNSWAETIVWIKNKYDDAVWHAHSLDDSSTGGLAYYKLYFFSEHLIAGIGLHENKNFIKFWNADNYKCIHTFVINNTYQIQELTCYQDYTRCIAGDVRGKFYEYDIIKGQLLTTWKCNDYPLWLKENKDYPPRILVDEATGVLVSGPPYCLYNKDRTLLAELGVMKFYESIPLYFTDTSDLVLRDRQTEGYFILKAEDIAALSSKMTDINHLTLNQAMRFYLPR